MAWDSPPISLNTMAEEDILDLEDSESVERQNKVEKRIKDLSEKVKLTSEERDEKERLLQEQAKQNESLKKENDFLNSFGDAMAKYPNAVAYKDKIKEKVLKGYSMDDAINSTLISEGKYNPPLKPEVPPENPAGGSAATQHTLGGEKPISELTREEKRAKLLEAEQRGDISIT